MRVTVLADIHGNLPALEAVLCDVDAAGVDAIVLNGDIADGPMPRQTLDHLEELGERAVWVRGNTDGAWPLRSTAPFSHPGCPPILPQATSPGAPRESGKPNGTGWRACRLLSRWISTAWDQSRSVMAPPAMTTSSSSSTARSGTIRPGSPTSPSRRSSSGTPICRSTVSLIHGASSTPARSACPTATQEPRGALLGPDVTQRRTLYDTQPAAAALVASASDSPDIEFITGNKAAAANDAEAPAAFTEAIRQQAAQQ